MKHVIIEGPDRVGKDSLIANLQATVSKWKVIHWVRPAGNSNIEMRRNQESTFKKHMEESIELANNNSYNMLLWNRSHLGEFVYGKLYRNTHPDEWVPKMEKRYLSKNPNVYLILLTADAEFLINNDDGKSFSTKLKDKEKELELFSAAFNNSVIENKLSIKINDGDKYVDKDEIMNKVYNFVNNN